LYVTPQETGRKENNVLRRFAAITEVSAYVLPACRYYAVEQATGEAKNVLWWRAARNGVVRQARQAGRGV